ncbi:MAG: hypothetical protein LLG05_10470 [Porphyromonadaceae bacterium]|nr:hypothetical protein [Porphyromonadaceae bacterium]
MKQGKRITINPTEEEYAAIVQMAHGSSLSAFVIEKVFEQTPPPDFEQKVLKVLTKHGVIKE